MGFWVENVDAPTFQAMVYVWREHSNDRCDWNGSV